MNTRENFDQRGFSSAVFTHDRMHRPGADPERDSVQGQHAGELLAQVLHFEEDGPAILRWG